MATRVSWIPGSSINFGSKSLVSLQSRTSAARAHGVEAGAYTQTHRHIHRQSNTGQQLEQRERKLSVCPPPISTSLYGDRCRRASSSKRNWRVCSQYCADPGDGAPALRDQRTRRKQRQMDGRLLSLATFELQVKMRRMS